MHRCPTERSRLDSATAWSSQSISSHPARTLAAPSDDAPPAVARHPKSEDGATAVEYALLLALIAAVIFAAVAALGDRLPGLYESVCPAFGC